MKTDFRALGVLVVLTALPAIVGCSTDFTPANEVHGLRVLAVRGEPPTVPLGDETVIDALVVTPDDGPITLKWELCEYTLGADDLRLCPAETVLASGQGDALAFTFTEAVASRVSRYCDPSGDLAGQIPDGAQLPICGSQGFPATVRLVASGDGEEVVAVKTVYLHLPPGGQGVPVEPNQNPEISGLEGVPDSVEPGSTGTVSCTVDEESVEMVPDLDGELVEEEIDYLWFIAGGKLRDDTGEQIEFAADTDAERVTLWCVVQDGRGGVDWGRCDIPIES